ncbi:hypothetical protein [Butyrivibrio sp. AE2032]|uniref:hypothetical protein n=1 Tax=Butyrivibrio sp. AE2032 TaxID=1458463 RepID=UPI0005537356|nr:hypothetical protein [Butyrivibrio sp. AE2032]
MCEALRELMADELKEAEEKGGNLKEKELTPIIIDLRKANAEKDSALAEKDSALAEKDSTIAEKDTALAEMDAMLKKYKEKYGEI